MGCLGVDGEKRKLDIGHISQLYPKLNIALQHRPTNFKLRSMVVYSLVNRMLHLSIGFY